jgi:hypothetical protein
MSRSLYSPGTLPVQPRPDPLLLFIQQAQLTLFYKERSSESESKNAGDARVAA